MSQTKKLTVSSPGVPSPRWSDVTSDRKSPAVANFVKLSLSPASSRPHSKSKMNVDDISETNTIRLLKCLPSAREISSDLNGDNNVEAQLQLNSSRTTRFAAPFVDSTSDKEKFLSSSVHVLPPLPDNLDLGTTDRRNSAPAGTTTTITLEQKVRQEAHKLFDQYADRYGYDNLPLCMRERKARDFPELFTRSDLNSNSKAAVNCSPTDSGNLKRVSPNKLDAMVQNVMSSKDPFSAAMEYAVFVDKQNSGNSDLGGARPRFEEKLVPLMSQEVDVTCSTSSTAGSASVSASGRSSLLTATSTVLSRAHADDPFLYEAWEGDKKWDIFDERKKTRELSVSVQRRK